MIYNLISAEFIAIAGKLSRLLSQWLVEYDQNYFLWHFPFKAQYRSIKKKALNSPGIEQLKSLMEIKIKIENILTRWSVAQVGKIIKIDD